MQFVNKTLHVLGMCFSRIFFCQELREIFFWNPIFQSNYFKKKKKKGCEVHI